MGVGLWLGGRFGDWFSMSILGKMSEMIWTYPEEKKHHDSLGFDPS